MIHKSLKELKPEYEVLFRVLLEKVQAKMPSDYKIQVGETLRELTTQMAYYACGRMSHEDVTKYYLAAGLWKPSTWETGRVCTQTLDSYHIKGQAVDFQISKGGVFLDPKEDPKPWYILGETAEEMGFTWGGRWGETAKSIGWDAPHVEHRGK